MFPSRDKVKQSYHKPKAALKACKQRQLKRNSGPVKEQFLLHLQHSASRTGLEMLHTLVDLGDPHS